jgi:two-component system, OmpR family, KDP operon response regulator KdpE
MTGERVLIVDDEPQIRRALRRALVGHGYDVEIAEEGDTAIDLLATRMIDAVVLDLMMPGMDGFEVVREIRSWSSVPIIVLSVRDMEEDKVNALNLGADDYLTKPFGINELLARLRAVQRRSWQSQEETPVLEAGEVIVDVLRRLVTCRGQLVRLTPTEYALLVVMVKHAGRVLTYRTLVEQVWGRYGSGHSETAHQQQQVRVYISYLRRKLEADPAHPQLIRTEPGIGYRFWPDR